MLPSAKIAMLLERGASLTTRAPRVRPKEEPQRPQKLIHCTYTYPDLRVCREPAGSTGLCKKHEAMAREAACDLQDGINQREATAILHEIMEGQNRPSESQQAYLEALGYGREYWPMPEESERLERYQRNRRQR